MMLRLAKYKGKFVEAILFFSHLGQMIFCEVVSLYLGRLSALVWKRPQPDKLAVAANLQLSLVVALIFISFNSSQT